LKKIPNELGKENSINLNLAITYSEMNQIDKAKELLKKIKLDQLEKEEKNTYQTISQKLK
jgi:thioredoxin-like negative regulator of GroEL